MPTGRTHQLRVHAADARGFGIPIWAIASMDAVRAIGYIYGTYLSIRNPDKLSIYEQRRHFDESLHLRQIVYSTLSQLEAREQCRV